jgi:hypothetical protein
MSTDNVYGPPPVKVYGVNFDFQAMKIGAIRTRMAVNELLQKAYDVAYDAHNDAAIHAIDNVQRAIQAVDIDIMVRSDPDIYNI